MKKRLSMLFSVLMILSTLASCASDSKESSKNASEAGTSSAATSDVSATPTADEPGWKSNTDPVTFDWYINFSWYKPAESTTMISKYLKEKTGVSINFIVPAGNEKEKLNTMIAGGSLPDMVTISATEDSIRQIIEADLVYSLNDLADEYDPYFYEVADKEVLDWYAQPDGKTYGYNNSYAVSSDYKEKPETIETQQTFLVRKDMYEALGKPDMRTPEGFLKALEDAKAMYPEVNGQPLIPFALHEFSDTGNYSLDDFLQNFLAISKVDADNKLIDRREDPEYLTWLKTLRTANEKGLISSDIFIDKRAQIDEKVAQGRYFAMLYQKSDVVSGQAARNLEDPNSVYIAVDGMFNSNLDQPKLNGTSITGWTQSLITKNCENPDRAIQLFTYWISDEGQRDLYLGKEGESWDMVDGKEVMKPELKELLVNDRDEHDKIVGMDPLWMLRIDTKIHQWKPEKADYLKQMDDWTIGKSINYAAFDNIAPPTDSEQGIVDTKIKQAWGLALPKLILAESEEEFDSLFQDFVKTKTDLGYDKLMEYEQAKYEENLKKLPAQE
ncbi:extracellular solute-binding protein [Scatolibacter rhodanostii]|uniref:extracellular solute-binding protein n=1 Tax=Scatolibacter rhodanostii TaxID=2014781 RepID=UPI001FA8848F|nr:extracellular solute-binding protein [Scatolibacter rhodanostii]